jgi:hypothetical protein
VRCAAAFAPAAVASAQDADPAAQGSTIAGLQDGDATATGGAGGDASTGNVQDGDGNAALEADGDGNARDSAELTHLHGQRAGKQRERCRGG